MKEFISLLIQYARDDMQFDLVQRQMDPVARPNYPFGIIDQIHIVPIGRVNDELEVPYRLFDAQVQIAIFSDVFTEYASTIASRLSLYFNTLRFINTAHGNGIAILNISSPFSIQSTAIDTTRNIQQSVFTINAIIIEALTLTTDQVEDIKGEVKNDYTCK